TVDDRVQRLARNLELLHGGGQPLGDRMLRARPRLVASRDPAAPTPELLAGPDPIRALPRAEVGHGVPRRPGRRRRVEVVTPAAPSSPAAANHATAYGILTRGGRRPVISPSRRKSSISERFV